MMKKKTLKREVVRFCVCGHCHKKFKSEGSLGHHIGAGHNKLKIGRSVGRVNGDDVFYDSGIVDLFNENYDERDG